MNERKSPVRLNQEQYFKAREWVGKHASNLIAERPTFAKLAAQMTAELGFAVSEGSARKVIHDAKLVWQPRFKRAGGNSRSSDRVAVAAKAAVELIDYCNTLGALLAELYTQLYANVPARLLDKLKKPIPADLQAIALRRSLLADAAKNGTAGHEGNGTQSRLNPFPAARPLDLS